MTKIRQIKRPVYRKSLQNHTFLKIFPNRKALIVRTEDLFSDAVISKTKDQRFHNNKDKKRDYKVIRKIEFITAYRQARKEIRI